jgi:hypothetical protein
VRDGGVDVEPSTSGAKPGLWIYGEAESFNFFLENNTLQVAMRRYGHSLSEKQGRSTVGSSNCCGFRRNSGPDEIELAATQTKSHLLLM